MVTWARTRPIHAVWVGLAGVAALLVAAGAFNAMRAEFSPQTLYPASVPSLDSLCSVEVHSSIDGDVSPLFCSDGSINTNAWAEFAANAPTVMMLGRNATPADVMSAMTFDLRTNMSGTRECSATVLAAAYYGWNFHVNPVSGLTLECPILK